MLRKLTPIACLATSLFLFSCQKEGVSKTTVQASTTVSSAQADKEVASALNSDQELVTDVNQQGYSKLFAHPGPDNGQDSWVDSLAGGDPIYLYGNSGAGEEVKAAAWTMSGVPVYTRFFIRFDDLAKITAGKTIALAKIYFSGLRESPIHLPQGNSCYPGSPYGEGHNQMYVKRVTSSWDESTITWASQPSTTDANEALTRASVKHWNDDLSVDVTSLVNDMVNGSSPSYGFAFILKNEQPYNSWGFYSSEAELIRDRPLLYVVYK